MHPRKLAFAAIIVLATSPSTAMAEQLPTRSDCIAGYKIGWSNTEQRRAVRNLLTINPEVALRIPVSGTANPDGDHIYFQFANRCEERFVFSQEIIQDWKLKIPQAPAFDPIAGQIVPSTKTIDLSGPHWSD